MDDLLGEVALYICNKLGGRVDFIPNLEDGIDFKWRKFASDGRVIAKFKWRTTYTEIESMSDPYTYAQSVIDKHFTPESKDNLPRSLPEKNQSFKDSGYLEHWMYVWELRELLDRLKPDDWLTPNQVNNLTVSRGDNNTFAAINFHWNRIEFFDDKGEDITLKGEEDGKE